MLDSMIQAQVVSRYFVDKIVLLCKMPTLENGDISAKCLQNLPKVNQAINTFDTICNASIMILSQAVPQVFC